MSMANKQPRPLFFPFTIITALAIAPCLNGLQTLNQNPKQPSSLGTTATKLQYHEGALLTGPNSINIYLIWYGAFSHIHTTTISGFFDSFYPMPGKQPTVSTWWSTSRSYKDSTGKTISSTVRLAKQVGDANYSLGKNIKRQHIANLVRNKISQRVFPLDPNGIYLVLTARDVTVERFCMGSCGFHDSLRVSPKRKVVYAHVGDPQRQCPGLCAWPYVVPAYGPPGPALVAPNGVGIDGMVMNIATVVAGAATNPFKSGYFQGNVLAPLEAVTACSGIFGADAYPGYPGKLRMDKGTNASYNANGRNGLMILLPAMWDPLSMTCKVVA